MAERNVVVANDGEGERRVEVIVGTSRSIPSSETGKDPFDQAASVYKTMAGLSAAIKKRASRLEKVHQSRDESAGSKKTDIHEFSGYDILGVVRPPYNLEYLAKLYDASFAHAAAVNTKTANIVGLGYDFIDSPQTQEKLDDIESEEKRKKIQKGLRRMRQQMFDWLDNCHEEDEFLETLRKVYIDYETTGNGYFEIGRTASGEVKYIGHIPSVSMRIRKKRDGFVQVVANEAVFFRHFGKKTTNPLGGGTSNEVIHIKKYNPNNSYYGVPDIISASQAVAGIEFASRFNLDYFENKAVPRYVIVIKGGELSVSAQSKIVEFFETGLRGQNHRTLFVPLPADESDRKTSFEMKPVEAGTQDASFVNYHKINLQSIFMAHRTPMSKTSLVDGVSLAAARDADKSFKEGVCRPEQKVLEKKLNRIIKERTNGFLFKLNELTLTDEDTQSKIDERYLRMQVLTPNEVRARAGMTGLKGGDKVVDLKAQTASEQTLQANGNRKRDQDRSAGSTDSSGEARSPKGEGRTTS